MFRFIKYSLYIISILAIGFIIYKYGSFYLMDFTERPRHPNYRLLKPGGLLSHGLGILGSLMMLLLLFYSVRKRTRIFGKAGALSRWLDIHIFFGTIGPALIILHSTLKLNGIVSISFWSMIMVVLSGILGRYLYIQIPRSIRGNELSQDEIHQQRKRLADQMQQKYNIDQSEMQQLERAVMGSVKKGLIGMVFADLFRFFRLFSIQRQLRRRKKIPKKSSKQLIELLIQIALLDRRIALLSKVHKLFHYWHVFHKPFAVIMYVIMFVHVGIAVWLGYTWIF